MNILNKKFLRKLRWNWISSLTMLTTSPRLIAWTAVQYSTFVKSMLLTFRTQSFTLLWKSKIETTQVKSKIIYWEWHNCCGVLKNVYFSMLSQQSFTVATLVYFCRARHSKGIKQRTWSNLSLPSAMLPLAMFVITIELSLGTAGVSLPPAIAIPRSSSRFIYDQS